MEECPYIAMASAYQDGELIEPRLTEFQRHLVGCAPCAQRLTELRNFSIGLAQSAIPAMSADAIARLHEAVESALDRGLLRIAWALSGVAAAILLSGALWLAETPRSPESAPPWVNVSVSSDADASAADASAADASAVEASATDASTADAWSAEVATPAAAWYLADASDVGGSGDR